MNQRQHGLQFSLLLLGFFLYHSPSSLFNVALFCLRIHTRCVQMILKWHYAIATWKCCGQKQEQIKQQQRKANEIVAISRSVVVNGLHCASKQCCKEIYVWHEFSRRGALFSRIPLAYVNTLLAHFLCLCTFCLHRFSSFSPDNSQCISIARK